MSRIVGPTIVLTILTSCLIGGEVFHAGTVARAVPAVATDSLERRFTTEVKPFLDRYCFACHGSKKPKAALDLSRDATVPAIVANIRRWEQVLERVHAREMPPEDAARLPKEEERARVVAWLRELRENEAKRNAGDPGTVLARRLSNAEFDYTIRDLTGVDIRPTKEFPVDPANEAGFDNSGESLAMSPALMKKYLAAARLVADHIVFKAGRLRVRAASGGDRYRPRQVLRRAHHRFLSAPQGRFRRLFPGRLEVSPS